MRTSILVLAIAAQLAFAEDLGRWESVQALRAGVKVGVIHDNLKRTVGRLQAAGPDSITVTEDGKDVSIAKDRTLRVYRPGTKISPTRIAIGAGVGVVVAVIVDKTAGERFRNEGNSSFDAVIWAAPIGAGAALGALARADQTIYRAPAAATRP